MSLLFIVTLLAAIVHAAATEDNLVISEIMFNPTGDENAREYVELFNRSSAAASLEGCRIGDGTGFDTIVPAAGGTCIVPPGGYALVMDPDYFTANEPYDDIPDDVPLFTVTDKAIGDRGLTNSTAESVYLVSSRGDTLSVVRYDIECPEGRSWERILPWGPDSADNFSPSATEQGTPGRQNSVLPPQRNPSLDKHSLSFNPPLPQPGETIELLVNYRNSGLEPLSDVQVAVTLLPDLSLGSVLYPETVQQGERSSAARITFDKPPCGSLGFMATLVSAEGVAGDDTVYIELEIPVQSGALLINEVMAAPVSGSPEWIELFNASDLSVDLFTMRVRDRGGSTSGPVDVHAQVKPGGYTLMSGGNLDFKDASPHILKVSRFPSLNNDGDSIVLLDRNGTVVDSMAYTEAPAGFSLERISVSANGGTPNWDTCVDPACSTPGRRNSIYFSNVPDQDGGTKETISITIKPNPFLETVTISYELPFPIVRVRILVYDRRGRLVATIRDVAESGSAWSGTWDGRSGEARLPAGPYILDIEILDKRTGTMHRERKTIVVASRL